MRRETPGPQVFFDPSSAMRIPLSDGLLPRMLLASLALAIASVAQEKASNRVLALRIGTVHPVSGPAIQDGVILIENDRIRAVGPADSVQIPDGAEVIRHPEAHAWPGLVDAMSRAFGADGVLDAATDAGGSIAEGLNPFDRKSRQLASTGVTTAYVSNRSSGTWRGAGALIRPSETGFELDEDFDAALHMRLTTGAGASHPLSRMQALQNYGREFKALEAYENGFEDFEKKQKEYDEAFTKYIDYHRKKNNKGSGGKESATPQRTGERGARGGNGQGFRRRRGEQAGGEQGGGEQGGGERGSRGGRTGRPGAPRGGATPPGGQDKEQDKKAADSKDKKDDGKAPERPKRPKEPKRDPAKDALIAARDGERAMFIEAFRADEIHRALEVARDAEVERVVIEQATAAAEVAQAIADAGVPVITTSITPPLNSPYVDDEAEDMSPVVALHEAGATFAIGSGTVERAQYLPLVAARAVGLGLPIDAAVRSITLTPAEILGVADDVGSLDAGKVADILITSGPLLSSDSRVLRVVSAGRTVHEAR